LAILMSWMGNRNTQENSSVIRFADVDRELRFAPGTAKKYIKQVASKWQYVAEQEGEHTILFRRQQSPSIVGSTRSKWIDWDRKF